MNHRCVDTDLVQKQAKLHKQREKDFKNIPDPVYFMKLEEGEEVKSILTKYIQDQLPDHLVECCQTINYILLFMFEQTFLLLTKQNITYNTQYMYMLRTVCRNQLSEVVCQGYSYENVICKVYAKNL